MSALNMQPNKCIFLVNIYELVLLSHCFPLYVFFFGKK